LSSLGLVSFSGRTLFHEVSYPVIFAFQIVHGQVHPKNQNHILPYLKIFYNIFVIEHSLKSVDKNLGAFYVIPIVLLVFLLYDTQKMVTEVTETCRCIE
jgi:hypothetical protein